MEPQTTVQPEEAVDGMVEVSSRSRVFVWIIITLVIIALALVAFYLGFRFATESDLTIGDLLGFLRQLYQWLTIR